MHFLISVSSCLLTSYGTISEVGCSGRNNVVYTGKDTSEYSRASLVEILACVYSSLYKVIHIYVYRNLFYESPLQTI